MSNSCYICGDGSGRPMYCLSCKIFADNKKDGFVKKFVNEINNYDNHSSSIDVWFDEKFIEPMKMGYKITKPSYKDLRWLADSRKIYRNAVETISDSNFIDKAKVEIAIFEIIKAIGDTSGVTKDEINSIVKIPMNRYIAVNSMVGDKLQKRGNAFVYGKKEIEMLLNP